MKTYLTHIGIVLLAIGASTIAGGRCLAFDSTEAALRLEAPELSEYEPDIEPGVPPGPGSGSR